MSAVNVFIASADHPANNDIINKLDPLTRMVSIGMYKNNPNNKPSVEDMQ